MTTPIPIRTLVKQFMQKVISDLQNEIGGPIDPNLSYTISGKTLERLARLLNSIENEV